MSCLMCNDTGHIALGSVPRTACPMCGLRGAEARIATLEAEICEMKAYWISPDDADTATGRFLRLRYALQEISHDDDTKCGMPSCCHCVARRALKEANALS